METSVGCSIRKTQRSTLTFVFYCSTMCYKRRSAPLKSSNDRSHTLNMIRNTPHVEQARRPVGTVSHKLAVTFGRFCRQQHDGPSNSNSNSNACTALYVLASTNTILFVYARDVTSLLYLRPRMVSKSA